MTAIIVIVVVVILAAWLVSMYNSLVKMRNTARMRLLTSMFS